MIHFSCPHCRARLNVPDEYGGQKADCPKCEKALLVPPAEDIPMGIRDEADGQADGKPPISLEVTPVGPDGPAPTAAAAPTPSSTPAPTPEATDEEPTFGLKDDHTDDTPAQQPGTTTRPSKLKVPELKEKSYEVPKLRGGGTQPPSSQSPLSTPAPTPAPTQAPDQGDDMPKTAFSSVDDNFEFKLAGDQGQAEQPPSPPPPLPKQAPAGDEKIAFKCSSCGVVIRVPAKLGGRKAKCPKCKTEIEIPLPPSVLTPADAPGAPAAQQPASAPGEYKLTEGDAAPAGGGIKLTRCVKCGFDYPTAAPECPKCGFDPSQEARGRMGVAPSAAAAPTAAPKSSGDSTKKIIIYASVAVVLLVGGFFGYKHFMAESSETTGKTDTPGATDNGDQTRNTPPDSRPRRPVDQGTRLASQPPKSTATMPSMPGTRYAIAEAVAFGTAPDYRAMDDILRQTALKSVYDNKQAREVLEKISRVIRSRTPGSPDNMGLDLDMEKLNPKSIVTVALPGSGRRRSRDPELSAVAILDLSGNTASRRYADQAIASANSEGRNVRTRNVGGITLSEVDTGMTGDPGAPGFGSRDSGKLAWGFDNDVLLLSDSMNSLARVIEGRGGKLTETDRFKSAMATVTTERTIGMFYVDLGRTPGPKVDLQVAATMGLHKDALQFSMHVAGLPEQLDLLPRQSFDQDLLDAVPASATFFAALHLDPRRIINFDPQRIARAFKADPRDMPPDMMPPDDPGRNQPNGGDGSLVIPGMPGSKKFEELDEQFKITSLLLRGITGDVLVIQTLQPGFNPADVVVVVPLADEDAFDMFDRNLMSKARCGSQPIDLLLVKARLIVGPGFRVYCTKHKGMLYLANNKDALDRYMQFRLLDKGDKLVDTGSLGTYAGAVDTSGFLFTWADTSAHLDRLASTLRSALISNQGAKELGLDKFPFSALRNIEAGPTLMSLYRTDTSLTVRLLSPAALPIHGDLVTGAITQALDRLGPILRQARVGPSKEAQERLKFLQMACKFYAESKGHYPRRLSDLYPDYINDLKLFAAPAQLDLRISNKPEINVRSGYAIRVAGRPADRVRDGEIVIYEKPAIHKNRGGHVALADGTVKWLDRRQLDRQLRDNRPPH